MKPIIKPVVVVCVITLSFLFSITTFWLPGTLPLEASKEVFSSGRAMLHVENMAKNPHPRGSSDNALVRDYIIDELLNLGLKPEVQKAYAERKAWGTVLSGNVENIMARLKGTDDGSKPILMMAHYDSTSGGSGAADDAAGVAAILETIRALKSGPPLKNDIVILITDGEEDGLLGAKAFADSRPILKDISLVINFEARGNSGPVIMFETGDKNGWFMKEFKKASPFPVAYSFAYEIYKYMPNDTDFTIFKSAGLNGFNFAAIDGYEAYHSKYDNPQNLNQRTLQHYGSYALSLAKYFGNLSLENRESSNAVYFTIIRSILVLYSEKWVIPLAVLTCILFGAVLIIGFKRRFFSLKGEIFGFITSLLMIGITTGVGFVGHRLFAWIYVNNKPELSQEDVVTIIKHSNIWIAALIVLSIIIMGILYRWLCRKISYKNMLCGALTTWVILAVVLSVFFKSASYMFIWPSIMALAGLLLQISVNAERNSRHGYLALFTMSSLSCILIFTPVVFFIFKTMVMTMTEAILGLSSLPIGMIILGISIYMERYDKVERDMGVNAGL